MKFCFAIFFSFLYFTVDAFQKDGTLLGLKIDSNTVNELNLLGYKARLSDPEQTITYGLKAKKIANKISFINGEAEANRILGIGNYYLNQRDSALNYYLISLELYENSNNEIGQAKVANNIGNLWNEIDYDKAGDYYKKSLKIAEKYNLKELIAGSYLNIGNSEFRKKNYTEALKNYQKSSEIFYKINNPTGITQSLQNRGVIYFNLNNLDKAELLLIEANHKAKEFELNATVASINLTLGSIYTVKGKYILAENYLNEGIAFARLVKNEKILYDLNVSYYELETKRKNFEKALFYLKQVHIQDSINFKQNTASNINLIQETLQQQQIQKENELTIEKQKNANIISVSAGIVTILCFVVIFLLFRNNKKTKENNKELTTLNTEVKRQKNNVDKINHHLEEIITERTKDLITKNQKLSEYSLHLSHQIRGPVATLKGLILLILDGLVESKDVVPQIKKCVDEIDDQIMDINESLHNPSRPNLRDKI